MEELLDRSSPLQKRGYRSKEDGNNHEEVNKTLTQKIESLIVNREETHADRFSIESVDTVIWSSFRIRLPEDPSRTAGRYGFLKAILTNSMAARSEILKK